MKNQISFLFTSILILFLSSCEVENTMTDDELIDAIINYEEKVAVSESELPFQAQTLISNELTDDYVDLAKLAPGLGFQVEMRSIAVFEMGLKSGDVFFDVNGRKLERAKGEKDRKKRIKPCFKLKYPVSLELSDGKIVEVKDRKEHCELIKNLVSKDKSSRKEIKIIYPVTVIFYDSNKNLVEKIMEDDDDFKALKESCVKNNSSNKRD